MTTRRAARIVLTTLIVVGTVGVPTPAGAGPADPTCRSLWPGYEDDTVRGLCRLVADEPVGAAQARLFVHEDVSAGRVPDDDLTTVTYDALERSLAAYTPYGAMPSRLDVAIVPRLGPDEDANAGLDFEGKCVVTLRASTFTDVRYYQQVLAHELFHCFQLQQDRTFSDAEDTRAGEWWFEGTAEYFSNVVYPDFDYEHDNLFDLRELEPDNALVDLSYDAFVFFQHFANRQGNAAVVEFMKMQVPGGGRSAQMAAAAAWPGMNDLFFDFAKAYLSNGIIDTSGDPIPINAAHTTLGRHVINRPGEIFRIDDLDKFEIHRLVMEFPAHQEYDIERDIGADVRTAAQKGGPLSPWEELADPIQTCDAPQKWRFIMTTTNVGATEQGALKVVDIVDDEGSDEGTQCCVTNAESEAETRAERRAVRIVVCGGAFKAIFRGGVCWVEDGFLMVTAGWDVFGSRMRPTGPYPDGYAFLLGTDKTGFESAGRPNVSISDGTEIVHPGVNATLTKSADLLTGTFTSDEVFGSYRCPRLTPVDELEER